MVYRAYLDTNHVCELYSAAIDATGSTKLNSPLVSGGEVAGGAFQFSADSSRVVYRANQDVVHQSDHAFSISRVSAASSPAYGSPTC